MSRAWQWFAFPVFAIILLGGTTAACAAQESDPGESYDQVRVQLDDGRTVLCLDGYSGALSCDWAGAK